jgi:hypothetical protein
MGKMSCAQLFRATTVDSRLAAIHCVLVRRWLFDMVNYPIRDWTFGSLQFQPQLIVQGIRKPGILLCILLRRPGLKRVPHQVEGIPCVCVQSCVVENVRAQVVLYSAEKRIIGTAFRVNVQPFEGKFSTTGAQGLEPTGTGVMSCLVRSVATSS